MMLAEEVIMLAAALLLGMVSSGAGENLLSNAGFSDAAGDKPEAWKTHTWSGTGEFGYAPQGRKGTPCVTIESSEGGDLSWKTSVALEEKGIYRLSGWIRTEDLDAGTSAGALLNIHELQRAAKTDAVAGTRDWTRVEKVFRTSEAATVSVNALFGGWGKAKGKAWFDDIRLEKIGVVDLSKPLVQVHAGRVREPMPVAIYSQFIEHLGRCIYGGIWAEMLEDRKFWFPITPEYNPYRRLQESPLPVVGASPWQIVGPAAGIDMVTEDSFVGVHTPRLAAGSGIRQRDLALEEGKLYKGHVWLKAAEGAPEVTVSLTDAAKPAVIKSAGDAYAKHTFTFTAGKTTDEAALEIAVKGGDCFIGTASLMPADNIDGMRPDTLALLRELNAPLYRWPGGNFVSGYNWRDGIGDRDRRPPRKNPAWTGVEHNDFGLDDFILFCKHVGAEPVVVVNTGFGDAYSAAQEVEYVNGSADTIGGGWRAENGHPEPYRVRLWGIGNEMYGGWQLGHMALKHYVLKHNEVVDAMRDVDPGIELIGVGATGEWTEGMLRHCSGHMTELSEHFYCQERKAVPDHVALIRNAIRGKADAHRRYRKAIPGLKGKDIRIAMDEWNYWYGPHEYGELGTRYFLKDALGIAAGVHEYARNSDIIASAYYAQTVNVIGCIKTTKTRAAFASTGLILKMYRSRFGTLPVDVTASLDHLDLDVAAAWTADRKALTLGVVNPQKEPLPVKVDFGNTKVDAEGKSWQVAGPDPMAYNEPGKPPALIIEEQDVSFDGTLTVPPYSATVFRFAARAGAM
jgi:alpha-L-arabinofuranosidase